MFSALPLEADIRRAGCDVRVVPILLQNRHIDGAGRPVHFFEAIHCHPLDCAGDLRSTLLTLATLTQRTKGANGGGRATNLASLRRFCAIAANVNSNWAPHGPRNRNRPSRKDTLQVRKQHFDTFPVAG